MKAHKTLLLVCLWSCSGGTSPALDIGRDTVPDSLVGDVSDVGDVTGEVWAWPQPSVEPLAELDLGRWDPRFYRASEISLNGQWPFVFDPDGDGLERGLAQPPFDGERYPLTIEVPFPWQSVLSGVGPDVPDSWAKSGSERELNSYRGDVWYARVLPVPAGMAAGEQLVLRLGAVDWEATVWVEGQEAGHHVGGYTPFEVDLTPWLAAHPDGIAVALRVKDVCDDDPSVLLGKQGTTWYSCSGGIWQDVVLERRPQAHLANAVDRMAVAGVVPVDVEVALAGVSGTLEAGTQAAKMAEPGPGQPRVRVTAKCMAEACGMECGPFVSEAEVVDGKAVVSLDLSTAPIWSPDRPCLLSRVLELVGPGFYDRVDGYMARRELSVDWFPGHSPEEQTDVQEQFKAIYSGSEPVYLRSVLDQGYHPEGIFQYPSKESRQEDLATMKQLGFNGIRQHIKPEGPWFYALADRLGLWVVYDFPAPGSEVASGAGSAWRQPFEQTLDDLVVRDASHPCILWWVLFNEAWGVAKPPYWDEVEGQEYVRGLVARTQELDPGRPVEDHSPGGLSDFLSMGQFPHVESDLLSFHLYASDLDWMAKRVGEVVQSFFPGATEHFFGGRVQAGEPLFNSEFGGLAADDTRGDGTFLMHSWLNQMHRYSKLQGYVFTEAYDVEWEHNGLMTYDRTLKEFGLDELGLTMADLAGDPYLVLGPEAILEVAPGAVVTLELGLSTSRPLDVAGVAVEVRKVDGSVLVRKDVAGGSHAPGYTREEDITVEAPLEPGVYVVYGEADAGEKVVRNALYLVVDGPVDPVVGEIRKENAVEASDVTCVSDGACMCAGWCDLTFKVPTPSAGRYRLILQGEMASYDPAMPQTDAYLRMSSIEIRVDEEAVKGTLLPDCPSDHRGVLSLLRHYRTLRGNYGTWQKHDLGVLDVGNEVLLTLRSHDQGVVFFFRGGGRFLRAPTLVFEPAE